jgi:Tol biopolymer transport system component
MKAGESRRRRARSRRAAMRAAVALGLAVVLAAGGAAAQYFGKNKVQTRNLQWKTLYTPHFEIHYYGGAEELAVRACLIAEQAYREYANRLDRELPQRVPFILYSSHNDFAQTNISDELIGEGTGGFSEPFRNRMVLPFNGSHADFVHVIRHELVHVFMFDMAFGTGRSVGRSYFFNIPLWFAEGVAEWLSEGWTAEADMFIRDATINDYILPLQYAGGFMVYKQGQAAMRMLSERYGEQELIRFWRAVGRSRSVERAVSQVYGLEMDDLDELYLKTLRKQYWPRFADLDEAEDIARRLTDHREDRSYYNVRASISPDGQQVAFFSSRDGLPALYLMSALDGKILRKLGQGHRSSKFESLHSFGSSIGFSPDGAEVAFIAKSGNQETLHTVRTRDGELTRSLPLGLEIASSPAWAPDGRHLAVVGTRYGRTDLYLLDLEGGDFAGFAGLGEPEPLADGVTMLRLTDDIGDEGTPVWSPDGRRLAFAFNHLAEIDFEFTLEEDGTRRLSWARPRDNGGEADERLGTGGSIVLLEVATGRRHTLFTAEQGRSDPVWLDGRTLCMVEDESGIANLALVTLDESGTAVAASHRVTNVLGGLSHPSYSAQADRLVFTAFNAAGYDIFAADQFRADWVPATPAPAPAAEPELEIPPLVMKETIIDTLPDAERVGLIEPYHPRFSLDTTSAFGGGGVYFNSAVGLGVANVLSFSDMLGDHRLRFLVNFYGSFDNSDLAASYFYLKRRIDVGFGVFHYSNYYNSAITSIGELLPDDTLFQERNYGLFGLASYPLSTFQRFELELQVLTSERTTLEVDPSGFFLVEGEKRTSRLLQPSLSYTHDTAFYGSFGPVTGTRFAVSFAPAIRISGSSLDRRTSTFDLRKYWLPWRRNTFALRLVGAVSEGDDPRAFVLGGPWTLRGYDFYDYQTVTGLSGSRLLMANFEYRLPLLDYLIFGWPGRWGLSNIGATLFFDLGAAWEGDLVMFGDDEAGRWGFRDLRGDYGFGLRTRIGFLPLKFDWAWKTDLRETYDSIFHFSIGPEF